MPAREFFADNPSEVGLDPQKVDALFERAAREVNERVIYHSVQNIAIHQTAE